MSFPSSFKPAQNKEIQQQEKPRLPSSFKPVEKQAEEKSPLDRSFKEHAQEFASGKGSQVALGLTQAATAPLDLTKMFLIGEGLSGLDEAEEAAQREGIPFDKEKEKEKFMSSLEYFPTQSLAENLIEKESGVSLGPKDRLSKILRGIAEFTGFTKASKAATKAPLKAEEKALKETAEQFGLREFAGMEKEATSSITPVVSAKKQEQLVKELSDTSKKAVDEIIKGKVPVKKLQEMGTNLEDAYTAAYTSARKTATEMGDKKVDFSNVVDWINHEIQKTKSSSISLSKQDKIYIDILNNEKKNLIQPLEKKGSIVTRVVEKEIPSKGGTVVGEIKHTPIGKPKTDLITGKAKQKYEVSGNEKFIPSEGPKIDLITGKPIRKFEKTSTREFIKGGEPIDLITGKKIPAKAKSATGNQAIKQYQNFNDNVKGIWKKPEFSGSENTVKNAYAGLNEQIIKSIEKANPKLAEELGFANRIFSETSKLNQIDNILSKSFKDGYDPNKLARTLSNRRERAFLQRNLGKDSIQDMERIAKYGQKAEEKIFNKLKNPETVKDYLNNMTPAQLALLVGFKAHVGSIFYVGKATIHRFQGHLLTRQPTRNAFENFMKEAAQIGKSPAPLFMSAKKLEKAIIDEYGSEEELMKMSKSNSEENE